MVLPLLLEIYIHFILFIFLLFSIFFHCGMTCCSVNTMAHCLATKWTCPSAAMALALFSQIHFSFSTTGIDFRPVVFHDTSNDSTPVGRAVSVTRELDLSLLCRIWLFSRHLVSLAKIAEVWPPFFLATETPDIALEYTSREIWSE